MKAETNKHADYFRELELQRIESKYELESDEGGTAREKAIEILDSKLPMSLRWRV